MTPCGRTGTAARTGRTGRIGTTAEQQVLISSFLLHGHRTRQQTPFLIFHRVSSTMAHFCKKKKKWDVKDRVFHQKASQQSQKWQQWKHSTRQKNQEGKQHHAEKVLPSQLSKTMTTPRPKDWWCCSPLLGGAAFSSLLVGSAGLGGCCIPVLLWCGIVFFSWVLPSSLSFWVVLVFPLLISGGGAGHLFFCGALVSGVAFLILLWGVLCPSILYWVLLGGAADPFFLGREEGWCCFTTSLFRVVLFR